MLHLLSLSPPEQPQLCLGPLCRSELPQGQQRLSLSPSATIAPFFFVPCGVNVIELGAFDIPLCSVSQSEGLHAAHGLTMPHVVLFLI